jgi:hypothetical protein
MILLLNEMSVIASQTKSTRLEVLTVMHGSLAKLRGNPEFPDCGDIQLRARMSHEDSLQTPDFPAALNIATVGIQVFG